MLKHNFTLAKRNHETGFNLCFTLHLIVRNLLLVSFNCRWRDNLACYIMPQLFSRYKTQLICTFIKIHRSNHTLKWSWLIYFVLLLLFTECRIFRSIRCYPCLRASWVAQGKISRTLYFYILFFIFLSFILLKDGDPLANLFLHTVNYDRSCSFGDR